MCAQTHVKRRSPSTETQSPAESNQKRFPGVSGKALMCKCGSLSHVLERSY